MAGSVGASALAGIALGVVGTGVQAIGAIKQGEAAKATANYNAEVAANNAALAQQSAVLAGAAGNAQVEQEALKTRAKVGGIVAQQGASGVDVGSGSNLDVKSSAQQLGELNALTVRSNAAKTAYGYQVEGANYTGQQGLYQSEAANAMPSAEISAGGTLLGGIGSAAKNYSDFQLQNSALNTNDAAYSLNNAGYGNAAYNMIQNSSGF